MTLQSLVVYGPVVCNIFLSPFLHMADMISVIYMIIDFMISSKDIFPNKD